jgi:hypothetical protein
MGLRLNLALLLLTLGTPAWAADCPPLKMVNSIEMVQTPSRVLLPVSLNDNKRMFLLDTGGSISQITAAAATELGLHMEDAPLKLLDMRGHAERKAARVEKFEIGFQKGSTWLAVNPDPNEGKAEGFAGLYAPDLMGPFDIELDFAASKMNVFSQDHCDGRVVYWPAQAVGILPMQFYRQKSVRFPVTLDGKEMLAEMDTGAPNVSMPYDTAERLFGWKPDDPNDKVLSDTGNGKVYGHIFSKLDFQGVTVRNPHVVIHPNIVGIKDPNNAEQVGNRARHDDYIPDMPDILIGLDVLRRLHLYIAFKEEKIYISPGTGTPVTAPAAAAPPH